MLVFVLYLKQLTSFSSPVHNAAVLVMLDSAFQGAFRKYLQADPDTRFFKKVFSGFFVGLDMFWITSSLEIGIRSLSSNPMNGMERINIIS